MTAVQRQVFETWKQVEQVLEEKRIPKSWIARYYDIPKQVLHNAMKGAERVSTPNSDAIWVAIDSIEAGIWTEASKGAGK